MIGLMPLASFEALDGLYVVLSVFLLVLAVGLVIVLYRLAQTLNELTSLQTQLQKELLPVVGKVGGTLDRVNLQLDKVDLMTDSAVDVADNVDTTVRAITIAITKPVKVVSGVATGIAHSLSSLRTRRGVGDSVEAGRQAARQRVDDLERELEVRRRPTRAETAVPASDAAAAAEAEPGQSDS